MRALSVLRVLRRSNLTSSALLRGAICRSFASASAASSSNSSPAVVKPTVSGVPANPNVKTIRKELLRALDSDVNDLSANQDENITQYIKDSKFQILHNEATNQVFVARMVGDTFIEARFDIDPDQQEQNEEEEEEEHQNEENTNEEQQDGEGQEEDDISLDAHGIQIVISKAGGNANSTKPDILPSTILIESHVDSRGFLHVDSILSEVPQSALSAESFHPLAPKSNENAISSMNNLGLDDLPNPAENSMDFNELGDATKDHFYRYLEALGIDDQFGQFVQHYAQILRTQNYVKRMQQLRSFMA